MKRLSKRVVYGRELRGPEKTGQTRLTELGRSTNTEDLRNVYFIDETTIELKVDDHRIRDLRDKGRRPRFELTTFVPNLKM